MADSTAKATRSLPELPVELLLDILEELVGSSDKASHRAAASLAQSCRLLRASEAGKRARYIHALASLSLPAPTKMPTNLDYEIEALEQSAWPLQEPVQRDPLTTECVVSACLRGNEYIALAYDRRRILRYSIEASVASSPGSPGSVQLEKQVLRQVITLEERVAYFAVDAEADYCILVYGDDVDDQALHNGQIVSPQAIELRCLHSGNLALPEERARLEIDASHRRIVAIDMAGDHFLITLTFGVYEVRRWRRNTGDEEEAFPVILHQSLREQEYLGSVSLFSSNFVCVAVMDRDPHDGVISHKMVMYRIGTSSSHHLATFFFPKAEGTLNDSHFACGGTVAPGEDGLCVFYASNCFWLLSISALNNAFKAPRTERDFNAEWILKHMCKIELPKDCIGAEGTVVSGWRCATLLVHNTPSMPRGTEAMRLQFWDADPSKLEQDARDPSTSAHRLGTRTVVGFQHRISTYCVPPDNAQLSSEYKLHLQGARMIFCCHTGWTNDNRPWEKYHASSWKM